jgi:hypothetical protein
VRKLAIAAVLLAAALALASVGGCTSSSLPAPAASSLEAEPFGLTVGVEAHRVAPFSDELVRALRTTWFGLASALLNASPNRTGGDPRRDPRYLPHVRAAVAAHAAEIRSLAGRR